jgi:capsular exopolysaccharide synthesis family protein
MNEDQIGMAKSISPSPRSLSSIRYAPTAPSNGGNANLFRALWRRSWIVLLMTGLFVGVAIFYLGKVTPQYTSAARIYVQQGGAKIIGETVSISATSNYLNTQCEIIKSSPILSDAESTCGATGMLTFEHSASPVDHLKDILNIEVGKKDDIITVSLETPSPSESAELVNAVVNSYKTYCSEQRHSTASEVLKILQDEKKNREKELAEKTLAMTKFRVENATAEDFDMDAGGQRSITVLTDSYIAARMARIEDERRLGVNHPSYLSALEKEQQLLKLLQGQQARAADYRRLAADIDRTEKAIGVLDDRIKEVDVNDKGNAAMNIEVVEPAVPSFVPSHPRKTRILTLAVVGGLVAGLLTAFSLEWMDDRVISANHAARSSGLRVIGVIPKAIRGSLPICRDQDGLVLRDGSVGEAYRAMAASILLGPTGTSILVTSASIADGRRHNSSGLASGLAIALAEGGRRVLVIDADLRRPSLHHLWTLKGRHGLDEVLTGNATLADAVVRSDVRGVDLLLTSGTSRNPASLFRDEAIADLLDAAKGGYDHVLLDAPPATQGIDAGFMVEYCDLTMLVVAAHKTRIFEVIAARDVLRDTSSKPIVLVSTGDSSGSGQHLFRINGHAELGRKVRKDINEITGAWKSRLGERRSSGPPQLEDSRVDDSRVEKSHEEPVG